MKKKLKLKTDNILLIILIIVFLFAIIKIILFGIDLNVNKNDNKKLIEEVIIKEIDSNQDEEQQDNEKIDFDKLYNMNSDTIGWIRFNQDKVNNPIVHTSDNSYYLKHSFDKKSNQVGAIFMDYRNISFDDKNIVLFGHAMIDDTMFGSLKDVFKSDFFDKEENNYIKIINRNNETLIYQIFSYYIIEKEEYYITTSFSSDSEFSKFIDTIRKRSYKNFDIDVTTNDNILTLSTCSGTSGTTKRKVVHAKRIEN